VRAPFVAGLSGVVLVLCLATPAQAHYVENTPAPVPGGVSETTTVTAQRAVNPYAPETSVPYGPNYCVLGYHEFNPTPGCGGFAVNVVLHDVSSQPGFVAGNYDSGYFEAYADAARTFGCTSAAGVFDWSTAFVVRDTGIHLFPVYNETYRSYLWYVLRFNGGTDTGPKFFWNFLPVDFFCPVGTAKTQFGLKVMNLVITNIGSDVITAPTMWTHAGPYYA